MINYSCNCSLRNNVLEIKPSQHLIVREKNDVRLQV